MEEERKEAFLNSWRNVTSKSVIFKAFASEERSEEIPLSMDELAQSYVEENQGKSEAEMVAGFLESLHFTPQQCESIEQIIRAQSESSDWVEQRKGRITASNYHDVYTEVNTHLAGRKKVVKTKPLLNKVMNHQSLDNIPAIKWG